MACKKGVVRALVVALVASNVATVVWAGCFSTPRPVRYRTECYDWAEGIQHVYTPDPEERCGFSLNPFNACYEQIVPLYRRILVWSEPGCTGRVEEYGEAVQVGTVHLDRAYVCGEST